MKQAIDEGAADRTAKAAPTTTRTAKTTKPVGTVRTGNPQTDRAARVAKAEAESAKLAAALAEANSKPAPRTGRKPSTTPEGLKAAVKDGTVRKVPASKPVKDADGKPIKVVPANDLVRDRRSGA